jgi:hypothetical protein
MIDGKRGVAVPAACRTRCRYGGERSDWQVKGRRRILGGVTLGDRHAGNGLTRGALPLGGDHRVLLRVRADKVIE